MTVNRCSECDSNIGEIANFCCNCGASVSTSRVSPDDNQTQTSTVMGDLNGDGKVDWEDFKIAFSKSKKLAAEQINNAFKLAQDALKSAKEKDASAVEKLAKTFSNEVPVEKGESQINREKFQSALTSTIHIRFAEIIASKKEAEEAYLTYIDAQILTGRVRAIFNNALNVIPPQIEAACLLSETILAPSTKDKENKIKAASGIAGGSAGIGIVICAVGSALGWGAGVVASVATALIGTSIAGPIGWGVAGLSLTVIAGYFASTSNHQTDTERFLRVLKDSTSRAIEAIWPKYGDVLSNVKYDASENSQKN